MGRLWLPTKVKEMGGGWLPTQGAKIAAFLGTDKVHFCYHKTTTKL